MPGRELDPALRQRAAEIFGDALELPPDRRTAFVDEACGGHRALEAEVHSLLTAHGRAGGFPDGPPLSEFRELAAAESSALIGQLVGPYRILRELGHGGMGTVFLAERADGQYEQRVALKLVRAGFGSSLLVRRFLTERRILARLEHPHIARLLDGGVTADERPFLVMEFVDGSRLTEYAEARKLSLDARLQIFLDVCAAVQHAHGNLVVHRDLKPANILVTAEAQVKLLDFGIAKLLETESETEGGTLTALGLRAMTPEYAAPEQIRGDPVTTATDVYALGAVLYELLSGQRAHRLDRHSAAEIERVVCETDPAPPSSAARGSRTESERAKLRGDLDTIVLKALQKDPARRYASVEAMAEDIRRHQAGLPVRARPDTWSYRTRKFILRHRMGAAAAALFVFVLLAFSLATGVQAERTARERDRAEEVKEFVLGLFTASNPAEESRGDTITARTLLERGVARIDEELAQQPDVQAEMFAVVGNAYKELGRLDRAEQLLGRALAVRRDRFGGRHPDVARSLNDLASLKIEQGDYEGAEALEREALAMRRDLLGSQHLDVAASLNTLGIVLNRQANYDEAETLYREALAIRRTRLGPEHRDVLTTLNNLAMLMQAVGDYPQAESLHREVLATRRRILGEDHVHVAISLNNLGTLLLATGDYEEAAAVHREGLALQRKLFDPRHPDIALSLSNLGAALFLGGRPDEAEPLFREALAIRWDVWGPQHPTVATTQHNLGTLLHEKGDRADAESLLRTAVSNRRATLGSHPSTAWSLIALGQVLLDRDRAREAEPVLREAVAMQQVLAEGDWRRAHAESALGACLSALGRYEEAEPLLLNAYADLTRVRGEQDRATRRARAHLAAHYDRLGRPDQAAMYRDPVEN